VSSWVAYRRTLERKGNSFGYPVKMVAPNHARTGEPAGALPHWRRRQWQWDRSTTL